jgi:hypothetical protein
MVIDTPVNLLLVVHEDTNQGEVVLIIHYTKIAIKISLAYPLQHDFYQSIPAGETPNREG